MTGFREAFTANIPGWLSDGEGGDLLFSFGMLFDETAEFGYHGVFARFPAYGTDDSLSAIGRDRQIVRGFVETAASYELRLVRWLDSHKLGGNPFELLDRLAGYFSGFDVKMRVVNNAGNWYTRNADGTRSFVLSLQNWNWDGNTSAWSRFWVIVYPSTTGLCADEGVWGIDADQWGDSEGTWGTSFSPEQVSTIREIIRHGKPPWARCEWIICAFDDASFNPFAPEPDGTWGFWGKPLGGAQAEARLATARYFDGTLNTTIQTAQS